MIPEARLLIIHQGALGDFILTFPAIIRLQTYFQSIDVLCQNQLGKLAENLGLAVASYPSEAAYVASLFSNQIDPRIRILLAQYEHIIIFSFSDTLAQAINRVTENLSCRLPPKPPAHQRIHVTQFVLENIYNCRLIKKADAQLDDIPLPGPGNHPRDRHKILLHPGTGSTRKRWPLFNFLQVEAALQKAGFRPEFILGPAEENLADDLRQPDRMVHVLNDLSALLGLYNSAGGYIGNDSGASHLAAYSGLPSAVIFGPTDPQRWAPNGRAVKTVRPELQCHPCFEIEQANCEDPLCLPGTRPQKVIEAFYSVYSNWR